MMFFLFFLCYAAAFPPLSEQASCFDLPMDTFVLPDHALENDPIIYTVFLQRLAVNPWFGAEKAPHCLE